MRKVYLDDLPRKRGKQIDWKNSIDHKVRFVYDDIEGEIEIVGYDGRYLTLIFDNKKFNIQSGSLKSCQLSVVIGKMNRDYKYEVGTIVNGLEVLDQIRVKHGKSTNKGYKVKCMKCCYAHTKSESHLDRGTGCPVCDNKKIIKGINDIATTHPEYTKYFVNIEDAYKYSKSSGKKIFLKCPDCGFEKNMIIDNLTKHGFQCLKCLDGKSYPEKFVFSMLDQLNVEFDTEYSPTWADGKRYDFYIPNLECIIETHGEQHYNGGFSRIGKRARTLEEEQENDKLKRQSAINNNIKKYIVIDCRESTIEWIKNSVLNSELANIFDLSNINWLKCHEFACSNRVKEACYLWNSGIRSIREIGEMMKLGINTIRKYLKQGAKMGWCDYDEKRGKRKKCKVILNGKETIYSSKTECFKNNVFGEKIFDKLVKSKEPYKPFYEQHRHLEGMIIQYIDNENIHI